jgi:hypothetical protein
MLERYIIVDYNVDMKTTSTTVRISAADHQRLRALARAEKKSLADVLEEALAIYERQRWLENLNNSFAKLKANDQAWQDYQDELKPWDDVLDDGLSRKSKTRLT